MGFDTQYNIGFLDNPRRFNVAVTRAQFLLIIIGNPHVLNQDQYWGEMLWYAVDNEAYQGCEKPKRDLVEESDLDEREDDLVENGDPVSPWSFGSGMEVN